MVAEHEAEHSSRWAAVSSIATKIGCSAHTLHEWVKKAEVIHRRGPWRNFEAVEFAMLEWVNWFSHRRLQEPIGNIPPAEAEQRYYAMLDENQPWPYNLNQTVSGKPGVVHPLGDTRVDVNDSQLYQQWF